MFDLTDEEVLFNLEYNLAYQVALGLDLDEASCCQKTLHNSRLKLIQSQADVLVFRSLTDRIVAGLGVNAGKQRLDSTHILSNIARLTRLSLFCETIRTFLCSLQKSWSSKFDTIPASLRRRYLRDDGRETRFGDVASREAPRRLAVCARDVWRLVDRFRGDSKVRRMQVYGFLKRLLEEQCEIVTAPVAGVENDADASEPGVPVTVKKPEDVRSDSLQTPHDPDVTYSGHKGKGYEVQVAETLGNGEVPEIITHVDVTRLCDSDEQATIPVVESLVERGIQPQEMVADAAFGSTANVMACQDLGTELVAPVSGHVADRVDDEEVRKEDFLVDPTGENKSVCPAFHVAVREEWDADRRTIRCYFEGATCNRCELGERCSVRRLKDGTRVLTTTDRSALLEERRFYEQTDEFRERYAQRAGIEATNPELKRRHGLGRIRTRGVARVRPAVYLKSVACNIKRMVTYLAERAAATEPTATMATAGGRVDERVTRSKSCRSPQGDQLREISTVRLEHGFFPGESRFVFNILQGRGAL